MSRDDEKEVLKEALKEWMDEKYAILGKWTAATMGVAILGAMVYLILWSDGWRK